MKNKIKLTDGHYELPLPFRNLPVSLTNNKYQASQRALWLKKKLLSNKQFYDDYAAFMKDIIDKGYAYASGGSVYFDTVKFSSDKAYAKLAPWCAGNIKLASDGEGALADTTTEKKSPTDFALWKNSKPGEPSWKCPWGMGRPGWHIECSAMASDLLGANFDIHGGGEDLKFPHHDNELAQSEAQSGERQWVNYFMHAGHLNIQGLKMSKSLKNFISIKEVLKRHTARQIRILFLLQPWEAKMNYSDDSLREAASKEKTLNEFFMSVKAALRSQGDITAQEQGWDASERVLHEVLTTTQSKCHVALCDSFDYPLAMNLLVDLVGAANKYMKGQKVYKVLILQRVAVYVDKMLRTFGVMGEGDFGFVTADEGGDSEKVTKVVDVLSRFRDMVRDLAKDGGKVKELMEECDRLRDDVLPELGIRLEDVSGGPAVWKLDDPATLIKQRDQKRAQAKAAKLSKVQNQINARQKNLDKWTSASVSAKDTFAAQTDKYSQFDAAGKPTHDKAGKALAKKANKVVTKTWTKLEKAHAEYLTKLGADADFLKKMQDEVATLQVQLAQLQ